MVSSPASDPEKKRTSGVLSRRFLWITLGSCALVLLAAFESLAVTTVMPVVSAELDGERLYAVAFAGPLATGVIGMVVAGMWSDRRGPVGPLYASVALFAAGLVVCGLSPTMETLVAGRLVQGLGGGAITVALYVVVARVYPEELHPKLFAWFAAAWIVPSLVGPFVAGVVADVFGWQWVFLGVVVLVLLAMLMVVPALGGLGPGEEPGAESPGRAGGGGMLAWAALAALAVLGLNLLSGVPRLGGLLALACAVVALVAVRPLLPRGTLLSRRGLPSVILQRGLVAAAFFGSEVYLPYLLTERYGFAASLAGLALTIGGLSWAAASAFQGRRGERLPHAVCVRIGTLLLLTAITLVLATALLALPPAVAIFGWALSGAGMGVMYPRLSTLTLALSTPANRGFNSSAMSIADSLGGALTLATTGIVFALFTSEARSFPAVFALAAAIALAAVVLAPRVRSQEAEPSPGQAECPGYTEVAA